AASANPAPREIKRTPENIGRLVAISMKPPTSTTGKKSRRRAGVLLAPALATRRGSNHAPSASAPPTDNCSASLIARSRRVNVEAVATQNRVAYEGGRDIAELQAQHQRPRKSDAPPSAIDAALDDTSRIVTAEQKRCWTVESIGHGRVKETRTNHGYTDAMAS